MKAILGLIIFSSLFLVGAHVTFAQTAAKRVEQLHSQYYDMQLQDAALRERLGVLNEELKPENIANALAGFGSTRPEELRAKRKRQLEIEKSRIENQLRDLAYSQERLSAEIRNAESAAYQESAQVASSNLAGDSIGAESGGVPRWMVTSLAVAITGLGVVVLISLVRKRKSQKA